MDKVNLTKKLSKAKLVVGDIEDTSKNFFSTNSSSEIVPLKLILSIIFFTLFSFKEVTFDISLVTSSDPKLNFS